MLIALPFVVVAVFERSERATREWMGLDEIDRDFRDWLAARIAADGVQRR